MKEFLTLIPKTDLHLHLDGSLRMSTLIDLAKKENVELPYWTEQELRENIFKDRYDNLGEYLKGFQYTCAVLNSYENIKRCAYELAVDNQKENVRYIEVRFAPQLHVNKELSIDYVIEAVNAGLSEAKEEYNKTLPDDEPWFDYGIILCALRASEAQFSYYYGNLFAEYPTLNNHEITKMGANQLAYTLVRLGDTNIPVVGLDLAGDEAKQDTGDFLEAFKIAHMHFLKKTVHAGEAVGAESMGQAIAMLDADRIGHGLSLYNLEKIQDIPENRKEKYLKTLVNFISKTRLTIEVCLTSNYQTLASMENIKEHPLRRMLDDNLSVTICTDNRLVSNTTVTKEYQLAVEHFNISRAELFEIMLFGFKRSFFHGDYQTKRDYIDRVINYYKKIENIYFGDSNEQKNTI